MTLIAAALLGACGSEEGEGAYIRVTVDGVVWEGAAMEGQVVYAAGGSSIYVPAFGSAGGDEQSLHLSLPNPPALGTIALDGNTASATWAVCSDLEGPCTDHRAVPSHPGSLTIASIEPNSGRMSGTFTFTGFPSGDTLAVAKTFTSGTFSVLVPDAFTLE